MMGRGKDLIPRGGRYFTAATSRRYFASVKPPRDHSLGVRTLPASDPSPLAAVVECRGSADMTSYALKLVAYSVMGARIHR